MGSWFEVISRGAVSGLERKSVAMANNVVRTQAVKINPLEILSNIGKQAAQNVEKVSLTNIRTPEFNLIMGKIKSIDPVVAESIEKQLSAYNLNNERGLQKAKDFINSTVGDYSTDLKSLTEQVTKSRHTIDECARKSAESMRQYQIETFLDSVGGYNPELREKLIAKINKVYDKNPSRADAFVTNLMDRYGDGYNVAQAYGRLQESRTPNFGEYLDYNPFKSLY